MSVLVRVSSVCGDSTTDMSDKDASVNIDGFVCCGNCKSILSARRSWSSYYGYRY